MAIIIMHVLYYHAHMILIGTIFILAVEKDGDKVLLADRHAAPFMLKRSLGSLSFVKGSGKG